ncbi:MAG: GNAT family N-acetyltransferase [Microbacteriaceae bacterium]|nr:GNAT family N-acetyltransferase [Microbacteriaceae bacterium]
MLEAQYEILARPSEFVDTPDNPWNVMSDIQNEIVATAWGDDDDQTTGQELWENDGESDEDVVRIIARVDGKIVGLGVAFMLLQDDQIEATASARVHPDYTGQGLGSKLLEIAEEAVRKTGRYTMVHSWSPLAASEVRYEPAEGFLPIKSAGFIPKDHPFVRFALKHGYAPVDLTIRSSAVIADIDVAGLETRLSPKVANFEIRTWQGKTDPSVRPDIAELLWQLERDAPDAREGFVPVKFTPERVQEYEEKYERLEYDMFYAGAFDKSGKLVAFTLITSDAENDKPYQEDTVVADYARGNGLGLAIKLANLKQVIDFPQDFVGIQTMNANVNRHMRDINDLMGFKPSGAIVNWEKVF